jgi:hypothetical protein
MPKPDRADVPDSQISRAGYLYCLTHSFMPGIAKLGATRKHPIQRATELSAGTGVPGQFTTAYWMPFDDCFEAERLCHERFADKRVDEAREFFSVTVAEVAQYARELAERLPGSGTEGGEWAEQGDGARASVVMDLPWSELFASFDLNGPDELTPEEQAKCHALAARLRS